MFKKQTVLLLAAASGLMYSTAKAQSITSSANPSSTGSFVTFSTRACGGGSSYAVEFWWAQANTNAWKLIGNAQVTGSASVYTYSISWAPPAAGTYNIKATANQPSLCPNFTSPIYTQTVH